MTQNRRQFIRRTSGVVGGAALLGGGWWYWGRTGQTDMQATGLGAGADRILASLTGAGAVGEWVIAEHPMYDLPLPELTHQLRRRLELPTDGPLDPEQFSNRLYGQIQQDFADDNVLSVRQWQLSATEALAAAVRFRAAGVSTDAHAAEPREAVIAEVSNWGPRTTPAGELPNSFGEGFSALWFDAENAPRWAQIEINGERLRTTYRENRVLVASFQGRADLQRRLFGTPGEYRITLHDDMTNTWQFVDVFVVTEAQQVAAEEDQDRPPSAFCPVVNWGPKQTPAGVNSNPQPGGNMGLWIDIECAPADTYLMANDRRLRAHINADKGVITAGIPPELFQQAGEISLVLASDSASEQLEVGMLKINPQ